LSGCSSPSTRPNLAGWGWGCRSAVRSLNLITDDCGLPRTLHTVPFFNSICRHTHLARKRIVEDVCSIHMAANVSLACLCRAAYLANRERAWSTAQRCAVPACSVTRDGTGRTQRPSASATAERPRRRYALAYGSQAKLSRRTNVKIRSFRISLGQEGLLFGLSC